MINWTATNEEMDIISRICDRIEKAGKLGSGRSRMDWLMDLEAVHCNGCPLNLEKLLNFESFDFWHDVTGIRSHLNRRTGQLENYFLPRCAA